MEDLWLLAEFFPLCFPHQDGAQVDLASLGSQREPSPAAPPGQGEAAEPGADVLRLVVVGLVFSFFFFFIFNFFFLKIAPSAASALPKLAALLLWSRSTACWKCRASLHLQPGAARECQSCARPGATELEPCPAPSLPLGQGSGGAGGHPQLCPGPRQPWLHTDSSETANAFCNYVKTNHPQWAGEDVENL